MEKTDVTLLLAGPQILFSLQGVRPPFYRKNTGFDMDDWLLVANEGN